MAGIHNHLTTWQTQTTSKDKQPVADDRPQPSDHSMTRRTRSSTDLFKRLSKFISRNRKTRTKEAYHIVKFPIQTTFQAILQVWVHITNPSKFNKNNKNLRIRNRPKVSWFKSIHSHPKKISSKNLLLLIKKMKNSIEILANKISINKN